MKLLYDLFHQLYKARLFLELIYDRVIFQKSAFGFCSYSMFLVISFWVIDARYSKFLISVFFIMLSIIRALHFASIGSL